MTTNVVFNSLFIYSEKKQAYFFDEFSQSINLIHGPNTSGKSTLIQSLIYIFGINDGKDHLEELLELDVFFRLDCTFTKNGSTQPMLLIRDNGTLYFKIGDAPVKIFNGINGNTSFEHIKLKHFFHELFTFSLFLESKEEYKEAPIEAIFLPYYISQSVGWVYLRKSFSSLDFYRNFKDDYLDYYLGIENAADRMEKKTLETDILKIQKEQNFLMEMEVKHPPLQVAKITDEALTAQSLLYIEGYKILQDDVAQKEKEYLLKCNELSFLNERKSVVSRIKLNQQRQNPEDGNCPMCDQILPDSLELGYIHKQELNDTLSQIDQVKEHINKVQSEVNSLKGKIEKLKEDIKTKYAVFKGYSTQEISMDSWMNSKANLRLGDNIINRLGQLTVDLTTKKKSLEAYKTEEQVITERNRKNYTFAEQFNTYLTQLKVKPLSDERFTTLYKISAFPFQGVELLKTVMAYHFALNNLIAHTPGIHRLPFLLDAIFKEDLDEANKDLIISFIAKNKPKDTQLFITVSEKTEKESQIARYKRDFFNDGTKLILIGNGTDTRALLKPYQNQKSDLLKQTLNIINNNIS